MPLSNASPSRRLARAVLVCLLAALPSITARATDDTEKMVVQYIGNQQGNEQGKKVMLVAVRPPGGRQMVLAVPNKDDKKPDYNPIDGVARPMKDLKPDEYIEIEFKPSQNRSQKPWLTSVKEFKPADGEVLPNVYVFVSSPKVEEGGKVFTAVKLRKLGETITAAIPGGSSPDEKMVATLEGIKQDQAVEVTFSSKGKVPTIATIDPYAPPESATFVKATEVEIEGQKADAVELTVKGKPVTAIVTGKMANKKWVPDAKVAQMAKRLKPDQAIEARLVTEGDKTWLRYFTLEKETASNAKRATSKESADAKESADKKDAEKKSDKK